MSRILFPRAGEGQVILGGVVFTDGAAEADLGPNTRELLELLGAAVLDGVDELSEFTLDELHDLADRAGIYLHSRIHKADAVRVLAGLPPVDHAKEAKGSTIVDVPTPPPADDDAPSDEEAEPQEPAGAPETPPVDSDTEDSTNDAEAPTGDRTAPDQDTEEEETWDSQPSHPSTTTPTTTESPDSTPEATTQEPSPGS